MKIKNIGKNIEQKLKVIYMSDTLIDVMKRAYHTFKDYDNPPVPIDDIKEYLKLEGVQLDEKG